jgi:hypothetical protein
VVNGSVLHPAAILRLFKMKDVRPFAHKDCSRAKWLFDS